MPSNFEFICPSYNFSTFTDIKNYLTPREYQVITDFEKSVHLSVQK